MKTVNYMSVGEWDTLVYKTYGIPYSFQQQDRCRHRGVWEFSIPVMEPFDYPRRKLEHLDDMGVSFKFWLKEGKNKISSYNDVNEIPFIEMLYYYRKFYPNIDMIASDLHKRGILVKGDYVINIDW